MTVRAKTRSARPTISGLIRETVSAQQRHRAGQAVVQKNIGLTIAIGARYQVGCQAAKNNEPSIWRDIRRVAVPVCAGRAIEAATDQTVSPRVEIVEPDLAIVVPVGGRENEKPSICGEPETQRVGADHIADDAPTLVCPPVDSPQHSVAQVSNAGAVGTQAN